MPYHIGQLDIRWDIRDDAAEQPSNYVRRVYAGSVVFTQDAPEMCIRVRRTGNMLPFAVVGGFWYVWVLDYNLSVASAVGFIALAGVAAEFGVVRLIYLKQALERCIAAGAPDAVDTLLSAIDEGAVQRLRPKAMTVAVILAGLAPIMWSEGTGAEVMQRMAAPMIGGMITAPLLSMFVIPAAYHLMRRR